MLYNCQLISTISINIYLSNLPQTKMPKKLSTNISVLLGERIRNERRKARLTQVGLAEKMGLSMQQIQKYESGSTSISVERIYELAKILNVDVLEIIGVSQPKIKQSEFMQEIIKFARIIDENGSNNFKNTLLDYVLKQAYEVIRIKK